MTQQPLKAGVGQRHSLLVWGILCAIVGLNALVYYASSRSAGTPAPIMPLDDVYIHFQYARQLAALQPYIYNPGLPPTSGATSFAYPYLLAAGYAAGFSGLWLGAWAMLIGGVAQAFGALWIMRIASRLGADAFLSALAGVIYAAHGLFAWHAFSGMETTLISAVVLLGFERALADDRRTALFAAAFAALIRPEGAVMAGMICAICLRRAWQDSPRKQWTALPVLAVRFSLPLLVVLVQPVVNRLVTGSAVASGNSAKSLFGIIPFDLTEVLTRIVSQFARIFTEALMTLNSTHSAWLSRALLLVIVIGVIYGLWVRRTRMFTLASLGWWIFGAAAIATLDTAFWHFKRYQIPLFVLMLPFAALGLEVLARRLPRVGIHLIAASVLLVGSGLVWLEFVRDHTLNVGYVVSQPYQMARWLSENAPDDAVIAVHDVGMMRYEGDRTTLDIVGLTTPGAADAWRNGPGAVAQFITAARPDLLALYGEGHGYGLGYLQATDLFAEPLAVYPVTLLGERNVALAASVQGIYRPRWERAERAADLHALPQLTPWLDGMVLTDAIDVADLVSERAHDFTWTASGSLGGFPTEVYQFGTMGCTGTDCDLLDGGRRINGQEGFRLTTSLGEDAVLVSRVHAQTLCQLEVRVNEQPVAVRVIPSLPGSWLEYAVLIPAAINTGSVLDVLITPQDGCVYQPYHHWLYTGEFPSAELADSLLEFQAGALQLIGLETAVSSGLLVMDFTWFSDGTAAGDYKLFIHVIDPDTGEIVAQQDQRPGLDSLPPGNWLPGLFRDTITVNLDDTPPGTYAIAIGWYDPVTLERLQPSQISPELRNDGGRVFVGQTEIAD